MSLWCCATRSTRPSNRPHPASRARGFRPTWRTAAERTAVPEGQIAFEPAPDKVEVLRRPADVPVMWLTAEQSNSSLIVDDAVMLKIFRRISTGEHPEAEMSRYLTAHNFANAPALLGEVSRIGPDGQRHALAVAQAFVRNQGDAWTWALNQVNRAFDATASRDASAESRGDDIKDYHTLAAAIGRQLGTMHTVLARPTDDPAFPPRAAGREDGEAWIARAMELLSGAFDAIGARKDWDNEAAEADARALLAGREALQRALHRLGEGAGKAFLGGYREATGRASKKDSGLLDFFLIEKAAYEVNYEAANRPTWLAIPVGGLARIANRLLAPSPGASS